VIVAVIAVLMVQAAVDDVVGVIAVRYGFVTAAFAVNVTVAGIDGMAAVGIGFIDA
jgi:putative membrane protein